MFIVRSRRAGRFIARPLNTALAGNVERSARTSHDADMTQESIVGAGNVEAPSVAVLEKLGFVVTYEAAGDAWVASRSDLRLRAQSPLQLLGLYSMRQHRGADWTPTDSEVESMLKRMGSA